FLLFELVMLVSTKCAFLVTLVVTLFTLACGSEFKRINSMLAAILSADQMCLAVGPRSKLALCRGLASYRTRHTFNTRIILNVNGKMISRCYFAYFIGNIFFH